MNKRSLGRMDSVYEIRRICARLANHVLKGEITPQQSSSINGLLTTVLKTFEMADFHDKLLELEKAIKKQKRKKRK